MGSAWYWVWGRDGEDRKWRMFDHCLQDDCCLTEAVGTGEGELSGGRQSQDRLAEGRAFSPAPGNRRSLVSLLHTGDICRVPAVGQALCKAPGVWGEMKPSLGLHNHVWGQTDSHMTAVQCEQWCEGEKPLLESSTRNRISIWPDS